MDISGISTQIPKVIFSESLNNEEPALNEISQEQLKDNEIPETQSTPTQPVDQEIEKDETVKGVIRLLQEGHFKGVADIRLRINFSEELNAVENREIQKVIGEKVSAITDKLNTDLETFLSSNNLSEEQTTSISEQMETFTLSVDDLIKENFNSAQSSKEALSSGLSSNFEEFIVSLNPIFLPAETESTDDNSSSEVVGTEEPVAVTANPVGKENDEKTESKPDEGPEAIFQNLSQTLKTTFAESLTELTNALDDIKILPDISEPNGNGKAFDKFLSIYNNLQGVDTHNHNLTDGISVIV